MELIVHIATIFYLFMNVL
uniref:Uncharacterized protein n=1 Tax=Rhizophora mucronata TaxID=61149 RepID=A0A2P2NSG0_RHIMU